jgi:hypothetical protein
VKIIHAEDTRTSESMQKALRQEEKVKLVITLKVQNMFLKIKVVMISSCQLIGHL